MGIKDTIANWLGIKAVETYPQWTLATAEQERFNIPPLTLPQKQAELYQRLSWVAIAVGHVANEAAGVPLNVLNEIQEQTEDVVGHDFEKLLKRPNPTMSRFEFLNAHFLWRQLTGNSYWWLNRADEMSEPSEMWIIPSYKIEPVPDGNMYIKGYLYDPGNGNKIPLEPWEIVQFKRFNPFNPYVGMSPIEALATVAIGDMKMQEWNTNFFGKENAKLPGILSFADPIPDAEWERLKKDLTEQQGGTKRNLMMMRNVGQGGVAWVATAMSQAEMQFLDGREFTQMEIYDMFAPGLTQWLSTDTTNANAAAGRDAFMELAVWPLHTATAETITNSVLPAYGEDLIAEFEDVRPQDRKLALQEQEAFATVHTIDEVRAEYYQTDALGDERGDLLKSEITRVGTGGFPGTDIIEKEPIDNKAIERKQFKSFAEKRVRQGKPDKIQAFEFRHLDYAEGEALKASYKPDDFAPLVVALDAAVSALRAPDGVSPVSVSVTMPENTINLPETKVNVEASKQEPVNVVVQPEIMVPDVVVNVEPAQVTVENEVIVPEPKPKKTKVKRDANGDIVELTSE